MEKDQRSRGLDRLGDADPDLNSVGHCGFTLLVAFAMMINPRTGRARPSVQSLWQVSNLNTNETSLVVAGSVLFSEVR